MYKLTVIIPCFNVEHYVGRCIDSIINQTIGYDSVQIIAIDDASTDRTLDVLKEYEQRYENNICIIAYEQNRGQAYARNIALSYAAGEYVLYVDADDWIEKDTLEKMLRVVEKDSVDMVMCYCDHPRYEDAAINTRMGDDAYYELDSVETRKKVLMEHRRRVMACGRMIRKNLLLEHNIVFPDGYKFEDCYWTVLLFLNMKNIYIINETLYHYYCNQESTVNSGKWDMDRLYVSLLLLEEVKRRGIYEQYRQEVDFYFYEKFFTDTVFSMFRFGNVSVEVINVIKHKLLEKCDISKNEYYQKDCEIKYSIIEKVLRSILEEEVTAELLIEVNEVLAEIIG